MFIPKQLIDFAQTDVGFFGASYKKSRNCAVFLSQNRVLEELINLFGHQKLQTPNIFRAKIRNKERKKIYGRNNCQTPHPLILTFFEN